MEIIHARRKAMSSSTRRIGKRIGRGLLAWHIHLFLECGTFCGNYFPTSFSLLSDGSRAHLLTVARFYRKALKLTV
jgi:hypothetical protein